MSKVSNMKLEDIIKRFDLLTVLKSKDISYFCTDVDAIYKFYNIENKDEFYRLLIENEEYIDKESLLLLTAVRYADNLKFLEEKIKSLEKMFNKNADIKELSYLRINIHERSNILKDIFKIGHGMNKIIDFYYYDEKDKCFKIEIIDSRKFIDNKKINNNKNLNRFKKIDSEFRESEDERELGIEYMLQAIVLTDLYEIFCNFELGNDVRTMLLENNVLNKGIMTKDEINDLRNEKKIEEYSNIVDNVEYIELLPRLKEILKQYVEYIDIDKLLLISAYRFNEVLENDNVEPQSQKSVRDILLGILPFFKNENISISCELQSKKDNKYEMIPVKYSVKDIKKCLKHFTKDGYLSNKEIEEYKRNIQSQEKTLEDIDLEYVDIIYNNEELEKISLLNEKNLIYVSIKQQWKKEKIIDAIRIRNSCTSDLIEALINSNKISEQDVIELYMDEIVDIEKIKKVIDKQKISEIVNSYELNQYYLNSIDKDSTEKEQKDYKRYLQLYKEIKIRDVKQEDVTINENEILEQIADKYNEKDNTSYYNIVKEYYKEGLLTLYVLVEWNGKEIVDVLYNENLIDLQDIEKLVKTHKIDFDYMSEKYLNIVNNSDTDYDKRLECLRTGYIPENTILNMYKKNLLFEDDLKKLANEGIISEQKCKKVVNSRTKEELEKHSSIKLVGLNQLSKRRKDIYIDDDNREERINIDKNKSGKIIIDPYQRKEYIDLFKARLANTDLEEDNPFYNYEFYVIPDDSGDIGLNSVVIAERYYDNKETEEKFATNNATYFFKYKDLMVLGNMKKSEMTKERENIVFTSNHILATEERNGYWATSVLYGIVKTMLSSNLKEYSKENQRKIVIEQLNKVYDYDEIMAILDKCQQIDLGEYNAEIINPDNTSLRKRNKIKKDEDELDNDKERE